MKIVNLKKFPAVLVSIIFIFGLTSITTACEPDLFFGDLAICENINEETFEPVNQKNEFDINIGKIYATIEYSGAKGEDNYRFNWVNLDTGENILDKTLKYSEDKSNYFEGYAMSYIATNEEVNVIPPGNYKVDFYHNGELKSTANFMIEEPGIEIMEVSLANKVDENSVPINETQQFLSTEIIYACININYYISGNSLTAKWYDNNGELVVETVNDLDIDLYEPAWMAFTLKGEGRDIPAGTYNVEIYLNDDLYGTFDFEVVEERQAAAGDDNFTQGNIYSNDKYGVSFSMPDGWTYTESESADGLEVNLVSGLIDLPVGFLFMASALDDYPPSDRYRDFADEMSSDIAADNNWEILDVQENEFVNGNDITFHDFVYTYRDQDNNDWATAIAFAEGSSRLYVLFVTVRSDYFEMGRSIYNGITGTMDFK
jgi:hypothetical protein